MLPELPNWQPTKTSLHHAAELLSIFRKADIEPLPNHLHHSLTPTADGVTTGETPHLGSFDLHYPAGTITHTHNGVVMSEHRLGEHTQHSLFEALAEEIHELDYDIALKSPPDLRTEPLVLNDHHAAAFASVSRQMFAALAGVRAHFLGFQTPIVLWSHGFDLSTLWFPEGDTEEKHPHLNMGFSPGTSGHPEPYIYTYAWPVQTALRDNLPSGFQWNTNWGTHGAMLPYRAFAQTTDPVGMVGEGLLSLYRVANASFAGAAE